MAREEITIVTCDKCGTEDDVNWVGDDGVSYRMRERGWNCDDDEDICPACQELIKEDEKDD